MLTKSFTIFFSSTPTPWERPYGPSPDVLPVYNPFFSNQVKGASATTANTGMITQGLTSSTSESVIFPRSPQVRTVLFMKGRASA